MNNESNRRHHREAAYGGEQKTLENRHLRLNLFKRIGGWGWGELYGPEADGERPYLGILEYLAEVDFVAYAHPMRMEAETMEETTNGDVRVLRFPINMQTPEEPCMAFDNISPAEGTVTLSLAPDEPFVRYRLEIKGSCRAEYRYLRGPWLRVGAYDDGMARDDAMVPGQEWLIHDEWSSGTDFHGPGNHMRVTPHPHKIHFPMMTIARNRHAVTLSWPLPQDNIGTMERMRGPQPVFASPNFIDHRPEHILGLMLPTAEWGLKENELFAEPVLTLPRKAPLVIDAEIGVQRGKSLDAVSSWVRRNGMPEPPPLRWPKDEAMDRIARALNTHMWEEGHGFTYGVKRPRAWHITKPWGKDWMRAPHMYLHFIDWYAEHGRERDTAAGLAQKAEWCRKQGPCIERPNGPHLPGTFEFLRWYSDDQLKQLSREIMDAQKPDGDFSYDPDCQLAHFAQHAAFCDRWKPLGLPGDTVFELCMTPSILLLLIGDTLGLRDNLEAARKTLEFAMPIERPAGGDWWECPLQAPNLFSALHGSVAYWLAWRIFEDERYRERARHFLRALLPFTYLWQPHGKTLLYETKPLYGTTGWHYMAWNNRCVLWHIVVGADLCLQLGYDWAAFDPEIDWATYRRGVAAAGLRWLIDSNDLEWMHRCEDRSEMILSGSQDMALADVHDPVDDMYGGLGFGLEGAWVAGILSQIK